MRMRFTAAVISALLSTSLASPRPDPEADPGYRVIKTVQIWDDEEDANKLFEDIDLTPQLEEITDEIFEDKLEPESNINPDERRWWWGSGHYPSQAKDEENGGDSDNNTALETTVDKYGRTCVKKLMMTTYTDFTEVMTCVHKSKERCHTTYVTNFEPHQEQKCDEKFEKRCTIHYEDVAQNDEVEVCKTSICPDCSEEGEEECTTVYDTVCETKRNAHNVTDDVVNCETVYEEGNCIDVNIGQTTEQKCEQWPRQKCTKEQKVVTKYSPETSCDQVSRELCAPKKCKESACQVCENQVKAVIVSKPKEECDLEPMKSCRFITKMVPHLLPTEECVEVPQEVCGVSKIKPVKKQRPVIQLYCTDETGAGEAVSNDY